MDSREKALRINRLRDQISVCQRCRLCQTRTNTVPGEGSVDASIMFIGEAPGHNEDLQGKPFVGRAGEVFDQLLQSAGMTRQEIFLCNILKCRPPDNRNPLSDEIRSCVGSLDLQIKLIDPQILAPMGNFAATYIFEKFSLPAQKITAIHGKIFPIHTPWGEKRIVPLFHPAVATYDAGKLPELKRDFQVFQKLKQELVERTKSTKSEVGN